MWSKNDRTSSLAIPLSQQNDSSKFKTPAQTKEIKKVQLWKGTEKCKQSKKKHTWQQPTFTG